MPAPDLPVRFLTDHQGDRYVRLADVLAYLSGSADGLEKSPRTASDALRRAVTDIVSADTRARTKTQEG